MADREKVIKGLEYCTNGGFCFSDCPYFKEVPMTDGRCITALQADALVLLKEQEPKPIAYTDNPYTGLPVARCPKCGKFARQFHAFTDEETHYCPWCGQEVKWDDGH